MCFCVFTSKNGSSFGVNRGWSGLAQMILLEWALISFDDFGLADPAGITSANHPLIKARPVVGFMEHDGGEFHLLCRDSDTLRKPKKSSSTGQVALKYFNRI